MSETLAGLVFITSSMLSHISSTNLTSRNIMVKSSESSMLLWTATTVLRWSCRGILCLNISLTYCKIAQCFIRVAASRVAVSGYSHGMISSWIVYHLATAERCPPPNRFLECSCIPTMNSKSSAISMATRLVLKLSSFLP